MIRICGNNQCSSSTGIHEGLTFGYGHLDYNGFWEYPCRKCAEQWDKERKERIMFFTKSYKSIPLWVSEIAWPYDNQEIY